MLNIHEKIGLAQCFGEQLAKVLTVEQMATVISLNEQDGPQSNVCHSHDFCDANVYMLAAWQEFFGSEFPMSEDMTDAENEANTEAFNDAWAIAKAARFFC